MCDVFISEANNTPKYTGDLDAYSRLQWSLLSRWPLFKIDIIILTSQFPSFLSTWMIHKHWSWMRNYRKRWSILIWNTWNIHKNWTEESTEIMHYKYFWCIHKAILCSAQSVSLWYIMFEQLSRTLDIGCIYFQCNLYYTQTRIQNKQFRLIHMDWWTLIST